MLVVTGSLIIQPMRYGIDAEKLFNFSKTPAHFSDTTAATEVILLKIQFTLKYVNHTV